MNDVQQTVRLAEIALRRGSDEDVNESMRGILRAFTEAYPESYLGRVNLRGRPAMWPARESEWLNFDSDFIVPKYNAELEKLINDRELEEYTGTAKDAKLVRAIFAKVADLGGESSRRRVVSVAVEMPKTVDLKLNAETNPLRASVIVTVPGFSLRGVPHGSISTTYMIHDDNSIQIVTTVWAENLRQVASSTTFVTPENLGLGPERIKDEG